MIKTKMLIGPEHHGRRMSLKEFDHAKVKEGYLYELSRGVIVVSDVPKTDHLAWWTRVRNPLIVYQEQNPGVIHTIAGGGECKILLTALDSERHPDLAIYKTPPPAGKDVWSLWIPEIVVEVVSLSSAIRDYQLKREEYLDFGVQEYWIVDGPKQRIVVLQRFAGEWRQKTFRPGDKYKTKLLPGFVLDCSAVLKANKK